MASTMGYTIVVLVALGLGLETRPFSVALRVAVAMLAAWGILYYLVFAVKSRPSILLLLFLLAFILRMIADQDTIISADDDLIYYLLATLAPVIAISTLGALWDDKRSAISMAQVGIAACVLVVAAAVFDFSGWRSNTANSLGRFSYDVLDPITVGNVGAMTAIAGLCWWLRGKSSISVLAIGVGLIVLVMGLSRGPMLSLGCAFAAYLILSKRYRLLILLTSVVTAFIATSAFENLARFLRFDSVGVDVSSTARFDVMRRSIESMVESPLFGSPYLDPVTGLYPHNLFVEAGLTLGLSGLVAALFLSIRALQSANVHMRRGDIFLFLTLIYWFVEAQVSGAIWTNVMFWSCVSLALRRLVLVRNESGRLYGYGPRRLDQISQ